MKGWEVVADNLKKADGSLGWVSTLDLDGRTLWIADAHRDDGKKVDCVFRNGISDESKAKPYTKTRRGLTRQIYAVSLKGLTLIGS
jgi:hypothetical protein